MDAADLLLILVVMVVFANYAKGTLGEWISAKFLNRADPTRIAGAGLGAGVAAGVDAATSGATGAGAAAARAAVGVFSRPVPGPTISPFGAPRDGGARRHEGNDLAARTGEPVKAARSGRVSSVTSGGNYGLRVNIEHGTAGAVVTVYAHLSRVDVRIGQLVAGGAVIGLAGDTGNARGNPHLHFEIRVNGRPIDPAPYISGAVTAPLTPEQRGIA